MKRYQILITWNNVNPELNPHVHDNYNELLAHAKKIRQDEGNKHNIYYLEWDTDSNIDPKIYFKQWAEGRDSNLAVKSFDSTELEKQNDLNPNGTS